MKAEWFFVTGAVLVVCVLFLAGESGLVSVARAKGKPPKTTPDYGYAELTDTEDYFIWSDGEGEYVDVNIPGVVGEDQIEIDDEGIVKSGVVLGRIDQSPCSSRRVLFKFDINACERIVESPKAVLDILLGSGDILDEGAVHLAAMYWRSDGVVDYVAFIVDPGCDGTVEGAITQEAVNGFCTDDTDENYRTAVHEQVIYYLGYPGYPNPDCVEPEADPNIPDRWMVTCSGPVTLYVMRTVGNGKSKGGAYEKLELATCQSIPLKLTMWLDGQAAPGKYYNLSTAWGEIKDRFRPGIR